jgi:hypothetical protein
MFQNCISLLVIVGLFAGQTVATPHAHAGSSAEEQRKHDATPHFHSQRYRCGHDHGHSDGEHSHSHGSQPQQKSDSPPAGASKSQPLPNGLNGIDHDANAVFVPLQAGTLSTTGHNDTTAIALAIAAMTSPTVGVGDIWQNKLSTPRLHPPDAVQDGSERYLTLRNLRI